MRFHGVIRGRKLPELYVVPTAGVDGLSKQLRVTRCPNISWTRASPSSLRHMIHSGRRVSNSTEEMITILKVIKRLPYTRFLNVSTDKSTFYSIFFSSFFLLLKKQARRYCVCYVAWTWIAKFAASLLAPAWFTTKVSSLLQRIRPASDPLRSRGTGRSLETKSWGACNPGGKAKYSANTPTRRGRNRHRRIQQHAWRDLHL